MRKIYEYEMDLKLLNIGAFILLIPFIFLHLLYFKEINVNIYFLVYAVIYLMLHEFFHGIGFYILRKVKHKNINYGIELEKGIFYCTCKEEINKLNILVSLMFPCFFLGFVTLIIAFIINNQMLSLLSIMNISGSIGDILMFIMIIKLPSDIKYIDLDLTTGFYLISKEKLPNKSLGFSLKKVKDYNGEVASTNKKITITKVSKIILSFIFILILLSFVL